MRVCVSADSRSARNYASGKKKHISALEANHLCGTTCCFTPKRLRLSVRAHPRNAPWYHAISSIHHIDVHHKLSNKTTQTPKNKNPKIGCCTSSNVVAESREPREEINDGGKLEVHGGWQPPPLSLSLPLSQAKREEMSIYVKRKLRGQNVKTAIFCS